MCLRIPAVSAHSTPSAHTRCNHHARRMSPCCLIQACSAIPAATPALMLRVEPNWAIDTVITAPARVSSVMPTATISRRRRFRAIRGGGEPPPASRPATSTSPTQPAAGCR
jgi:hypothetical protein